MSGGEFLENLILEAHGARGEDRRAAKEALALDRYQEQAARTLGKPGELHGSLAVLALGLAGEAGEVADLLKKHLGHGHPLDKEKLVKELGDVLWYVAGLANNLGVALSEVAGRNIEKLKARYPDGFSTERSVNRRNEK